VLQHGTGALNVDGCRVGTNGEQPSGSGKSTRGTAFAVLDGNGGNKTSPLGRWPANLIISYNEDEYKLRETVTPQQLKRLSEWLCENT
jgi:hypothetical protein